MIPPMARAKYINPYTDFGFKKLFGEEGNKDLLQDFLNELLPENRKIKELTFQQTEQTGEIASSRKAVFDIYCRSAAGERFIVEMQKAKLNFFKDRTVFYSTFPIREQAEKGEWDFELSPVYCVALLDFVFDDGKVVSKGDRKVTVQAGQGNGKVDVKADARAGDKTGDEKADDKTEKRKDDYLIQVKLKNQYCEVFYDKLEFIFVEMPRFDKTADKLTTHFEKWLYFLKHLEDFDTIPDILREEVFEKAFMVAEIANFNQAQLNEYESSLKTYRDLKAVIDTAHGDGFLEGKLEGKLEGLKEGLKKGLEQKERLIVLNMLKKGLAPADIGEMTGVLLSRVLEMQKELS